MDNSDPSAARAAFESRRALLKTGAAAIGGAAPATAAEQTATADPPHAGFIDAHSHVWTSDVRRYPLARWL